MKKILGSAVVALTLSHTTLWAGNCATYGTAADGSAAAYCFCEDAGSVPIRSASWAVNTGSKDGSNLSFNDDLTIAYCANASDTSCSEARPTALTNGSTLYLKNTSTGATDYFKCAVNFGTSMTAVAYTPSAGGGSTAVPIGPFGLLALLAGIMGSAFVGLRRKKA